MTVKELIKQLKKLDQDSRIRVFDNELGHSLDIEEVKEDTNMYGTVLGYCIYSE